MRLSCLETFPSLLVENEVWTASSPDVWGRPTERRGRKQKQEGVGVGRPEAASNQKHRCVNLCQTSLSTWNSAWSVQARGVPESGVRQHRPWRRILPPQIPTGLLGLTLLYKDTRGGDENHQRLSEDREDSTQWEVGAVKRGRGRLQGATTTFTLREEARRENILMLQLIHDFSYSSCFCTAHNKHCNNETVKVIKDEETTTRHF